LVVNSFMEATSRACTVVVDNGNLVKKVAFPCELLPVHLVGVATMVFLVGSIVLMSIGLATGTMAPDARILLWPVVVVVQIGLALGVGLALACIHVFMRDASYVWGLLGQAWLFLSPTFWQLEGEGGLLEKSAWAEWLRVNPLYSLMQAHRLALGVTPGQVDGTLAGHLATATMWAAGALVFGHALFMSRREKFADLV
jgi:ABC-type polysaccharide/polyol phosphate export permease